MLCRCILKIINRHTQAQENVDDNPKDKTLPSYPERGNAGFSLSLATQNQVMRGSANPPTL